MDGVSADENPTPRHDLDRPAWGQGGRAGRAASAQQTPTPQAEAQHAGPAGRGGGAAKFYNYDSTAGSGPAIPDAPPAETHQKITLNGEALAYTAWAGYLPLGNATMGQSGAHLFETYYAKDGAGVAPVRPLLFFWADGPAWRLPGARKRARPSIVRRAPNEPGLHRILFDIRRNPLELPLISRPMVVGLGSPLRREASTASTIGS
jgi:hypothetical protein